MRMMTMNLAAALLIAPCLMWAQEVSVPRAVNYSGVAKDISGKTLTGVVGATFAVYAEQDGGAPLWMETQNITAGANGKFKVVLGATQSGGLPMAVFSSGQGRWLGVSYNGGVEQPRTALLSVPYALKAGDAQTIGGLPPSAFVLAAPGTIGAASDTAKPESVAPAAGSNVTTTGGTVNTLPLWTTATDIQSSAITQTGSGATAKIGIGIATPATALDVKGGETVRGPMTLTASGTATAAAGANSEPQKLVASAFNSTSSAAANQTFQWQAEPAGNNTASPSGTLNLLFGSGAGAPSETGLQISKHGVLTFASGQAFPGVGTITGVTTAAGSGLTGGGTNGSLNLSLMNTCSVNQVLQWNGGQWGCGSAGAGTITGVTAGTDLTGGGASGNITLNLNTSATDTRYAQLAVSNTFNGLQTFNVNGGNAAIEAYQNAVSGVTYSLIGTNRASSSTAAGILGQELGVGEVFGVEGYITNLGVTGAGVFGQSGSTSVIGNTYKGLGAGVWGDVSFEFGQAAVLGTADSAANSVVGFNNSLTWAAMVGENQNTVSSVGSIAPGVVGFSYSPQGVGVLGAGKTFSNSYNTHVGYAPFGVVGDSPSGFGVAAFSDTQNALVANSGSGIGVYGSSVSNVGVYGGSTSQDGVVGYSANGNGVSGSTDSLASSGGAFLGPPTGGQALVAGTSELACWFDNGNMGCTGNKSAVVPVAGDRWVRLFAVESPDNWFEDFGEGRLSNGSAVIALESEFAQTVNTELSYHVYLTPNGDSRGLYVSAKSANSFEVREQSGGTSNIAFDYRIVARRKGYENVRLEDATGNRQRALASLKAVAETAQRAMPKENASEERRVTPRVQVAGRPR